VQTSTGCSTNGYADYTTTDTVIIQQTAMLSISVTSGYQSQHYALWIDINNDGDFDDAHELLWNTTSLSGSAGTATTATVVVPSTVSTGNHRMRLRGKYSGSAMDSSNSCSSYTYGEVHDYTVNVSGPPACPAPYGLNAYGVTATQAIINYTTTGSAFEVEYGPVGFVQGTGTTATFSGATDTLTGLSPNTCYDVYVRQNCSAAGNGYSLWSGPLSFCTPCVTQSMPLNENFASWAPNCFFLTGTGSGSFTHYASGSAAMFDCGVVGSGQEAYMTTPPINLSSLSRVKFKWSHLAATWYTEGLTLLARTSGSATWDTLWTKSGMAFNSNDGATTSAPGTYIQETLNLDSATYYGQVTEFRWVGSSSSNWGYDFWVDDIVIEAQPACPEPTAFNVQSVTDVTATLNFTSAGASFPIQYGPTGFTLGTGPTDTATTTTHTLTGLTGNTTYDAYVMRDCSGASNGLSPWTGPITFTTLCAPINASSQYFENFDNGTDGDPVACWNINGSGNNHSFEYFIPSSWNPVPYSGTQYGNLSTSGSSNVMIVSPLLGDLTADSSQIRFRALNTSSWSTAQLAVGTLVTPSNSSSFVGVDTVSLSTSWQEFTVAFTSAPSNHQHIAIKVIGSSTYMTLGIEDIYYEEQPSCLPATNASVAPLATSASVSWTAGSSASSGALVTWGPAGYNPGTGALGSHAYVSGTSYTIPSLTSNTAYTAWVADSCGASNLAPWVGPLNFTTSCLTASMPYVENFDANPLGCWDMTGGTKTMLQYASGIGYMMHGDFWSWTSGNDAHMTSRPVAVTADAQIHFDWAHQYMTWYPNDQLLLLARPSTQSAWDTISNLSGTSFDSPGATSSAPGTLVNEFQYLPTSYTGDTVVFKFIANSGWGPDVFFDNFTVEAIPSCPPPSPSVSNVMHNSVTANWTSPNPTALGHNIMWGPVGFLQGTGSTGNMIYNASTGHVVTGLSPNTTYDLYVQDSCAANDLSTWAGPITFTTACVPISSLPHSEDFDLATSWGTGMFDQCWTIDGSSTGYPYWEVSTSGGTPSFGTGPSGIASQFLFFETSGGSAGDEAMAQLPDISVANGSFTLSFNYHMHGATMGSLFVEYFDGTNWVAVDSLVGQQHTNQTDPFTNRTVSITNPTPGGNAQLRFRAVRGTSFTGDISIDSVVVLSNCNDPSSLNVDASSITCSAMSASWTSSSNALASQVDYGVASYTPSGTTATTVSSNSISLTNLLPGTTYDIFVRDSCSDGWSGWSHVVETTASTPTPTLSASMQVLSLTPNEVRFTANAAAHDTVGWSISNGQILGGDVVDVTFTTTGPAWAAAYAANDCGVVWDTLNFTADLTDIGLSQFGIYPNPTTGVFKVNFQLVQRSEVTLRVLSSTGQVMERISMGEIEGEVAHTMDFGDMPQGVYFVELQTQFGIESKRVIIRH